MPKPFKDWLPPEGRVRIHWFDKEPEDGIYKGYHVGNTRRCMVQLADGTTAWVDRKIITGLKGKPDAKG